jgi:hypothetical protein
MQSAEFELKGKTTVPEAVDKSKKAVVSFEKQIEDIQKKFSTGFKDIFLGFTAPMVLLQHAIGFIQAAMEQARQDAKAGIDLIALGQSRYSNSEEAKAAAFFKRKKEIDDEIKLVKAGREEITKGILENAGGQFKDFELPGKYVQQLKAGSTTLGGLSQDKEVQRIALDYFTKTDAGKRILDSMGEKTNNKPNYSAPQGVNAVVGMGNNAVGQAMLDQLDEARKQTILLEQIASGGSHTPPDFTKPH